MLRGLLLLLSFAFLSTGIARTAYSHKTTERMREVWNNLSPEQKEVFRKRRDEGLRLFQHLRNRTERANYNGGGNQPVVHVDKTEGIDDVPATTTASTDTDPNIKPVESTTVTTSQFNEAIKAIEKDDDLKEAVIDSYVNTQLSASTQGNAPAPNSLPNRGPSGVILSNDEAMLSFEIARMYLKNLNTTAETKAQTSPSKVGEEKAKESLQKIEKSAELMQKAVETPLASKVLDSEKLSSTDQNNLAKEYLYIAAQQLQAASESMQKNFGSRLENVEESFAQALNAANSLEMENADQSKTLNPFLAALKSNNFLENGEKLLGKASANTFIAAVKAAELLSDPNVNLTTNSTAILASFFEVVSESAAPPCVGCFTQDSDSATLKVQAYSPVPGANSANNAFVDEMISYFNLVSKSKSLPNQEISSLIKGRQELEKIITTLKLYKSPQLVAYLEPPYKISPSVQYRNAVETAAAALFLVAQSKTKTTPLSPDANEQKILILSAKTHLDNLRLAKSPANVERKLRDFFENDKNNYVRELWRRYHAKNYAALRTATALIVICRSAALVKAPSFEKVTASRTGLAQLIWETQSVLAKRRALAEKQRLLEKGLLKLNPIPMAGDRKPAVLSRQKEEALIMDEAETAKYPSFKDE